MKFVCQNCGQEFTDHTYKKQRKYCGRDCFFAATETWNKGLSKLDDERVAAVAEAKHKNVVDRDVLYTLYVEQNLPLKIIGQRYGVTGHVIKRLVTQYGLKRLRDTISYETLYSLYVEQGKSTDEIGKLYNCTGAYILKLFRKFKIETRIHRNQAQIVPDADELRRLYWDEWMSYEQIAEFYNVDLTSIPYWLKKYGIKTRSLWETRRGKGWKEPDWNAVEHLYDAELLSSNSIAVLFDVSKSYITKKLRERGVEIRESGYPNVSRYTAPDGHRVKSGLELQADEWLSTNGIDHDYEPQIGNSPYFSDFRVGHIYIEIWGITGNEKYEKKRQKKLAVYRQFGLELISLYPADFPDLKPLHKLLE